MTATYNTIVAALAGQNTAATARNVAAVAEIITHFPRQALTSEGVLNTGHLALIEAVREMLDSGLNCVGVEEYSLAALYAKHRADGADEEDAMDAAYEAWAELDGYDAHEEVALA
jgi:hypothetical protein